MWGDKVVPSVLLDQSHVPMIYPVKIQMLIGKIPKLSYLPSIFLSNIRSLVSKIEDLEIVVSQNNAVIVCITETWLTESIPNSPVDIKNYSVVRKDRKPDKRGGGVCAYIKSSIGFTVMGIGL